MSGTNLTHLTSSGRTLKHINQASPLNLNQKLNMQKSSHQGKKQEPRIPGGEFFKYVEVLLSYYNNSVESMSTLASATDSDLSPAISELGIEKFAIVEESTDSDLIDSDLSSAISELGIMERLAIVEERIRELKESN